MSPLLPYNPFNIFTPINPDIWGSFYTPEPNPEPEPEPQMALTDLQAKQLDSLYETMGSVGVSLRPIPYIEGYTAKIPGIGEDVSTIKGYTSGIGDIASDVTGIKGQTSKIGGIASDVTGLGTGQETIMDLLGPKYSQQGLSQQVANLGNTLTSDTDLIRQYIGTGGGLQDYIQNQIGMVTANQGAQNTEIAKILGDVKSGGTLSEQIGSTLGEVQGLGTALGTVGENLTSGIGTITGGQADIQSALTGENGVGGIQGALTDLGTSLNEYQTGAQTQREDMLASLLGGQESISNTLGQQDVGGQLSQIATNMRRLQEGQQQDFASVAAMISSNVPAQTNTDVVQRAQFIQLMNNLRGFVGNPQSGLDPTTQATYAALTNAFDPNGRLIAQSQNPNTGSITARNITNDGQLVLRNFDSTGTAQTSQPLALNINALLNRAAATGAARQPAPTGLMAAQQPAGPSMTLQ